MNVADALTARKKKGSLNKELKAAAELSLLRQRPTITFVRAGRTNTWINKAEEKQIWV